MAPQLERLPHGPKLAERFSPSAVNDKKGPMTGGKKEKSEERVVGSPGIRCTTCALKITCGELFKE